MEQLVHVLASLFEYCMIFLFDDSAGDMGWAYGELQIVCLPKLNSMMDKKADV